jgi:probable HAF family extracellular repeat protein
MMSRISPVLFALLIWAAASMGEAQTATCSNWTIFTVSGQPTWVTGINRWGTVVGFVNDQNQHAHGFARYSDGSVKTYMAPNAINTFFSRSNSQGVRVGYFDSNTNPVRREGLVVASSGSTPVNYPGGNFSTNLEGINYWSTIVGFTENQGSTDNGFKLKNGVFSRIHYPNSANTWAYAISDSGEIVGTYQNTSTGKYHGFRLQNGIYKTVDAPNATGLGTHVYDINGSGVIAGTYVHNSVDFGFIDVGGVFKSIMAPNASDTIVTGINGNGYVTGNATFPSGRKAFTAHCQ